MQQVRHFEWQFYPPAWFKLWPYWSNNLYADNEDEHDIYGELREIIFSFSAFQFRVLWRPKGDS